MRKKIIIAVVALGFFGSVGLAFANPSIFSAGVTTNSTASSTPSYITAGVSTSTTPVYDAYAQTSAGGAAYKADSATLLVQFTGSSTNATLNLAVEYSQDSVDWYRSFVFESKTVSTTTSPVTLGAVPNSYKMPFASTTVGGIGLTNSNSTIETAAISIPTPTRYTRVVNTLTGANGAVWDQLVPIKERP